MKLTTYIPYRYYEELETSLQVFQLKTRPVVISQVSFE